MPTPETYTLDRVHERLDRLNKTVGELLEVGPRPAAPGSANPELSAALGGISLTSKVQTENIKALLDMVEVLASDIDELRHGIASDA
jgi:hypothetical protein